MLFNNNHFGHIKINHKTLSFNIRNGRKNGTIIHFKRKNK